MTEPSTLWELLSQAAKNYPQKGIVVHDDANGPAKKLTYSQLYREAMSKGNVLLSDGIISGDNIVVLYFESHSENIVWSWAVIAAGGIPAILSPLSSETTTLQGQLQNVCEIFQGPDVVTTSILAPNFQKIPGFRVHSTRQLEQIRVRQNGTLQKESRVSNKNPDDLALLLFTSGSTGHAKAVEFTHSQLMCSIRAKIIFHKHSAETRFFNWISFDHSANFCEMHLVSMYVGSDQYHAATSDLVNAPANFFTIIGTQKIGYAFAPSFFLALAAKAFLSQKPVPFLDFSNLTGLMCGGEANKTANIQIADSILTKYGAKPNTIKIAYGLSETCSAAFYNTSAPEYDLKQGNSFASVGTHMPDCIQIRLVDTDGTEVPPNTPGAIQLRGDIVFQRYYNNVEATSGCKTKDGWFNTGDLGIVDNAGSLSIVGRSKEVIIINGNNYSSFELEHCIESDQFQGVIPTYTASFGVFDENSNTEGIVILFVPNKTVDTPEKLRDTLLGIEKSVIRFCRKAPLDVLPLKVELLPKSTLGKLSRAKLKQRYESGAFDEYRISFHNQQLNGTYNIAPKATNGVNGVNGVNGHSNGINGHTENGNGKKESKDHTRLATEMQKTIASIISEETEVPLSSLKSDSAISRLGIDSLGYMRIKKCLETAFKMEDVIPMSILLQGTSIKELEDKLLSIGTVPPVYEPIVPLSTSGSKMPLFLLHPGSGEVLCWLTILKYLPDRPIYAVRAKGLHKDDGWFEDLDEMISCYINGIREYQPHGPYALLGFCLGGTIAFEIAKRFEADGEVVSFLAGIDNPPDLRNLRVLEDFRKILNDVLPQLGVITEEQMKEFNDEHDENTHFEDLYRALVAKFGEQILVPFDLTLPGLIQRARVDWSMRAIFRDYIPDGSVSKIDIFWVPPMEALNCTEDEWRNKFIGEWERFSKSKPNYFRCIGNHLNIMQGEENVQCFQKALNEALVLRGV